MRLLDTIRIALRNLWRRKLRTFLTLIAVSIGVIAVVSLVSLALGAQNAFLGQLESMGMLSQISISGNTSLEVGSEDPFGGGITAEDDPNATPLTDELAEDIATVPGVRVVYPRLHAWTYETMLIVVNGQTKRLRSNLESSYVVEGDEPMDLAAGRDFANNEEKHVIIVGDQYRKQLGKTSEETIGTTVTLQSHPGFYGVNDELPPAEGADEKVWQSHTSSVEATIIGVLPPGPMDQQVFVSLEWSKELMLRKDYEWPDKEEWEEFERKQREGLATDKDAPKPEVRLRNDKQGDGYDTLIAEVNDVNQVETVADAIEESYKVRAITPKDFLDSIMQIFTVLQVVLGVIGGIALGVAAIGIVNTMIMAIYERTREIGVMKAVGASRHAIRMLFTVEAALIGLLGGVIGIGVGYALSYGVNFFANRFFSDQSIPLTDIVEIPLYLMLGVLAFSTTIGMLAGLYPAARAARMDPIEALHHE